LGRRWAAARELDQKQRKRRGEEKEIVLPFFKSIKQLNSNTDLNATKQK
jgi:hypothetical protein